MITRDPAAVAGYVDRVWRPDTGGLDPVAATRALGTRLGHAAVCVGADIAGMLALT